jgi:hypothetical protein
MATTKVIPGVLDLNATGADKGLKMPSGTELNRPTDATGQIRNNTNETSSGSASVMEYYNGTGWKKLTVKPLPYADFLVIAGGGSGAGASAGNEFWGGAGGAGGLRTSYGSTSGGGSSNESQITLTDGVTYTFTVGAGGNSQSITYGDGFDGSDSSIAATGLTTITSIGGGGGGNNYQGGRVGGSGGGGGARNNFLVNNGTAGQGYDGGYGNGAGGGAGGAGNNGNWSSGSGIGGDGLAVSITGSSVTYASGGSSFGGGSGNAGVPAANPIGGGGGGSSNEDGVANSGGGGQPGTFSRSISGQGGSGLVVFRLPTSIYSGSTTGGPTVTTDGEDTILTYTGSGTYVH